MINKAFVNRVRSVLFKLSDNFARIKPLLESHDIIIYAQQAVVLEAIGEKFQDYNFSYEGKDLKDQIQNLGRGQRYYFQKNHSETMQKAFASYVASGDFGIKDLNEAITIKRLKNLLKACAQKL